MAQKPSINMFDCPYICPNSGIPPPAKKVFKEAGGLSKKEEGPYIPGSIKPPQPTKYAKGAPPPYLPQPTDSTSGDFLTMGPIDPWAPGHMDWSAQAGITGVRPVVDKYSITRYATGEWRKHNEFMLLAHTTEKGRVLTEKCHKDIEQGFVDIKNKGDHSDKMLDKRIKDLAYWKKKVEVTQRIIADELETLEVDRQKLKSASRILMLPEAISRECLELRTHRLETDLVRDAAEQELIREVAIVGEIRRVFNLTLMKVEKQLLEVRAAKAAIEQDWTNKMVALKEDKRNRAYDEFSTLILQHPGVNRWTENSTSLEYWLHFCQESINNCLEVKKRSENLRSDLMIAIVQGGQDMMIQCDRTNMALKETVSTTEALCEKLEEGLRDNLQKIADIENLLDYLRDSLRRLDQKSKVAMSRLHSRNYDRPDVESCRDEAQYAIMDEIKFVRETVESFKDRVRQADLVRAELMKFRGDLEKEIACKRKSLNIDRDRLSRLRAHMPTHEEFVPV